MPTVREPVLCNKAVLKNVKGIIYTCLSSKGVPVNIPTAIHPTMDSLGAGGRFPSFEAVLGVNAKLHESWVSCTDGNGKTHHFLVAAQYRPGQPVNQALKDVLPEVTWKGDLIVMHGGVASFVVNMGRASYRELAKQAVCKFLLEAAPLATHAFQHNAPLIIPTSM
ncbi:hypothetical protein C8Q79DRAFT_903248 [Trametes meyenii]|nr:hypothetical protein C8Q79DRAFT_903248 [Trametes meyenii]